MIKVLIIIPAYNESENIQYVIENLRRVIGKMNDPKYVVDYIVINDCSTDKTKEILLSIKANFLSLPVNLGIGGAVQAGYVYALENNYDIAIQMDGDGQHNPEYIKDLIEPLLDDETDTVIGSRFIDNEGFQSSSVRRFGINFLSMLIRAFCGVYVLDVTSGFRAVNREYIRLFAKDYAQDYPEPEAIVRSSGQGARIKEVPVIMSERMGGTSSIHGFRSIYYMIKVSLAIIITRFTTPRRRKKS